MNYSNGWRVSYNNPAYLKKYKERYSFKCEKNILFAEEINKKTLETITYCPSVEEFEKKCEEEKRKNTKKK